MSETPSTRSEFLGRLRNRWKVLVHDALMIPVAWLLAYWLRFNLDTIPSQFWTKPST
ncbi:MAG: hypothetical protein M5U09_26100 [Gammaproteobacteria bacterium]|nr:hypothetical protein [Gammaproteobacteria bacterium]